MNHQSCNQDLSSLANFNPNEVLHYMVFKGTITCMRSPEGFSADLIINRAYRVSLLAILVLHRV